MRLVTAIHVEGFRSLRKLDIPNLGHLTALAGLNNSGKSNILRALNAFFSGNTDAGQPLDVAHDFYRPDLAKQKKAKRIRVGLRFELPAPFNYPSKLDAARALLGRGPFWIQKEWRRERSQRINYRSPPTYYLDDRALESLEERQRIDQFLNLINFRYIPNRVLPTEHVRSEHRSLRDALLRKLSGKAKEEKQAFDAVRETAESLISALAGRFRETVPDTGDVRLATPTSWRDMVFTFGYRLLQGDVEIEDTLQGAGIQSLLMLETLYLIDRDYSRQFGWRQASIWAVEEPESSLHTSLEAKVASFLAKVSADPKGRLQALCTTHSDLFLQYADSTSVCRRSTEGTSVDAVGGKREALQLCARAGISRYVDPLLSYPLDPIILVEGKYDMAFIAEALHLLRAPRGVRVQSVGDLECNPDLGGKDLLCRYVRNHAGALKTRLRDAPVVVVFDWDAAGKVAEANRGFSSEDPVRVLAWPDSALNPKLGKTFRGIERAFSERVIEEARARGAPISKTTANTYVVEDDKRYGEVKQKLFEVVEDGLNDSDIEHARSFIENLVDTTRTRT